MPSLHRRRIHQILAHQPGRGSHLGKAQLWELVGADQLDRAGDQLGGALHLRGARLLEEVGVEQRAQNHAHVAVGLEVCVHQRVDRSRVLWRLELPGRHLRLVGDEEVVQVARYEACRGGLLHDDVDYVLAVEVAHFAQERLLAVVVVLLEVHELRLVVPVGVQRYGLGERPAGEGAGGILDVVLAIVAHAHREQFQQLAAPVLVGLRAVILAVVQPVVHRRVPGQLLQEGAHVGEAQLPEHVDLPDTAGRVLALVPGGGEDVMPEQGDLLLQGALAVDHAVHPAAHPDGE